MGVDASYLYGYGADVNKLEWDFEYLKEKYKDKLDVKIRPEYSWSDTWEGFINTLEEASKGEGNYAVSEVLDDLTGDLFDMNYDDESYITFNHTHIAKIFSDAKIKELDEVAKLYAKELGVKNTEEISWIEWGYFS